MMKKSQWLQRCAVLALLGTAAPLVATTSVNAMGYNPAMRADDTRELNNAKHQRWILFAVQDQLAATLPNCAQTYDKTALYKSLHTNFAHKNFPSRDKSDNGYNGDGELDINALKQPLTQPKAMQLADLVRYYYFCFTPAEHFTPIDSKDTENIQMETLDNKNQKLNYFDYVKLINLIKNNPHLTNRQREYKLVSVESDLQRSINALYGAANTEQQQNQNLNAFGENKSISVPFNLKYNSYRQLLASYKKTQPVDDTLAFYGSLLDTLSAIKQYSVQVRQGDPNPHFDLDKYKNEINQSYKSVDASLIQPMINIKRQQLSDNEANKKAQQWQTDQLGHLGLTDPNNN